MKIFTCGKKERKKEKSNKLCFKFAYFCNYFRKFMFLILLPQEKNKKLNACFSLELAK